MSLPAQRDDVEALRRRVEELERLVRVRGLASGALCARMLTLYDPAGGARIAFPGVAVEEWDADAGAIQVPNIAPNMLGDLVWTAFPGTAAPGLGWLTYREVRISGSLSGTTFEVQDTSGNPLPISLLDTILVKRGLIMFPSSAEGATDGEWSLATDGYTLTTRKAPLGTGTGTSGDLLWVALTRRRYA